MASDSLPAHSAGASRGDFALTPGLRMRGDVEKPHPLLVEVFIFLPL